jgi:SAM-dependent methyltransferase
MPVDRDWEDNYQTGDLPWDSGHASSELQRVVAAEHIAAVPALELGCGSGNNAVWLAQQGFDVTAVDISPTAIRRAKERSAAAGVVVRFVVADVTAALDLGGPFRFLFDRGCYHCVRDAGLDGYLQTLEKNLDRQALGLILTGNDHEERTGPPVVSEEQIRGELTPLFTILRLREFRFDVVDDQPAHLGWSCLVKRRSTSEKPG